jgi:hypothetical protein
MLTRLFWACFGTGGAPPPDFQPLPTTASAAAAPPNELALFETLREVSDEVAYRARMQQHHTFARDPRALDAVSALIRHHGHTPQTLQNIFVTRGWNVHLYATPVEEGREARDPVSHFLKRNALQVFLGLPTHWEAHLRDALRLTPAQLQERLRDCAVDGPA